MKNNFDAKKIPRKIAQATKNAGLKTLWKASSDVWSIIAQTQNTNTSLILFQKQVHQMNLWTRRMQISNPAEVFLWKVKRLFASNARTVFGV